LPAHIHGAHYENSKDQYFNVFGHDTIICPPPTLSSFEGLPPNTYLAGIDCLDLPIKSLKGLERVELGMIIIPNAIEDISDHFPRNVGNTGTLVMSLKPGRLMQLHDGIYLKNTISVSGWAAGFDASLIIINDFKHISNVEASEDIAVALMDYPDPFDFQEWCIDNDYEEYL
jgi:hypothetical protein